MKTPFSPRFVSLGLLPLLLWACNGGSGGYTFTLVPRFIEPQQPFSNSPDVKLLIQHASGEPELFYVGTGGVGDTVQAGDFPEIAAGSIVGIIAETAGGASNQYDPDELHAYGQIEILEDLTEDSESSIEVFIPQAGTMGELGQLSSKNTSFGAGVAMIPGGDVFIFGGSKDAYESLGSDKILRMSQTDTDPWEFEAIDLTTPDIDEGSQLTGSSATTVMVDDAPLIFVAGGRPGNLDQGGLGNNSTGGWLFDPATEEIVWGAGGSARKMSVGRSNHHALLMENGKVLLFGGWRGLTGQGSEGSYELFDPEARSFKSGLTGVGGYGEAGATLGDDGALICGGADRQSFAPVSTCVKITPAGATSPADSMPRGLFAHAMVGLGDGRVLATGGVELLTDANNISPATNNAFLYEKGSWKELDPMQLVRAYHMMVPTPEGKIIVVGGVQNAGTLFAADGTPTSLAEVFDPETETFTTLGGTASSNAGKGARGAYAAWPGEGAFVFAGYDESQTLDLGRTYGFIGFGPDL